MGSPTSVLWAVVIEYDTSTTIVGIGVAFGLDGAKLGMP